MALLFRHLRAHAVFGANTDVGKTILTTALCRAAAAQLARDGSGTKRGQVHYLKPVSTGPMGEADDLHVRRFAGPNGDKIQTACLFRYSDPVSPHLAATRAPSSTSPPSDEEVVSAISSHLKTLPNSSKGSWAFLETAGGPLSPSLSGTVQASLLRPLRLPVLLVGDSRLGGISTTLSAYESLTLRGWDIEGVLLFQEEYYRNWEYLSDWFADNARKTAVWAVPGVPARLPVEAEDRISLEGYYSTLCDSPNSPLFPVLDDLALRHERRIEELERAGERAKKSVWWPFTQHKNVGEVMVIDSAHGDEYAVFKPDSTAVPPPPGQQSLVPAETKPDNLASAPSLLRPVFDGSASWWTQALGHSLPSLTLAAASAAGRYGHVIFPSAIHPPALELAERLLGLGGPGEGWAGRVFWSDDGSTAVEVGLKMATRAVQLRREQLQHPEKTELGVLGIRGSYHGDTIGAMDASEPSDYSSAVPWYRGRGYWFDPPTVALKNSGVIIHVPRFGKTGSEGTEEVCNFDSLQEVYDVPSRLDSSLATHYRRSIESTLKALSEEGQTFGAMLLEPVVMGAGGMLFVDPLFQRMLVDVVRESGYLLGTSPSAGGAAESGWKGLPVIFDEVFVGFNRLGADPRALLGVNPDIAAYAKILTGGLVPMSVTLASDGIFDTFWGDDTVDALLHGHSYTAHPIGCAVANKTMELVEEVKRGDDWTVAKRAWIGDDVERMQGETGAWSLWSMESVMRMSEMEGVKHTMAMGTVLAITLDLPGTGYAAFGGKEFLAFMKQSWNDERLAGVHSRTLGRTLYFMCSLNTTGETLRVIEEAIEKTFRGWSRKQE